MMRALITRWGPRKVCDPIGERVGVLGLVGRKPLFPGACSMLAGVPRQVFSIGDRRMKKHSQKVLT
jgi:hypothetical protein